MGRLDGKVAFITGAARGQGRAHAVTLSREGADVVIAVDLCAPIKGVHYDLADPDDLAETRELVEAFDRRCVSIVADARSSAEMRAAADRGAAELGGIDIGVINHGIMMVHGWESITDEEWDTSIEVNLSAVWRASRAVIPHMIERGAGSLTLTSSASGLTAANEPRANDTTPL